MMDGRRFLQLTLPAWALLISAEGLAQAPTPGRTLAPGQSQAQVQIQSPVPADAARSAPGPQAAPALRTLVVLDFDLLDDHENPLTKAAQETRLHKARLQLQEELAGRELYRVLDPAPAEDLQRQLRAQQAYMHRCDDCAAQIGRLLGADLVMQTWVQKVSELILNLNVQIYDVQAQKVILSKSVDMRGNDDVSWTRAVRFLIRDFAEKRERNPRYGL
jgi:hypothetical protein